MRELKGDDSAALPQQRDPVSLRMAWLRPSKGFVDKGREHFAICQHYESKGGLAASLERLCGLVVRGGLVLCGVPRKASQQVEIHFTLIH